MARVKVRARTEGEILRPRFPGNGYRWSFQVDFSHQTARFHSRHQGYPASPRLRTSSGLHIWAPRVGSVGRDAISFVGIAIIRHDADANCRPRKKAGSRARVGDQSWLGMEISGAPMILKSGCQAPCASKDIHSCPKTTGGMIVGGTQRPFDCA